MGLFVRLPFALFTLTNVPVRTLSFILQQAHGGSTVDKWWFYLSSSTEYSSAPQKKPEGGGQEATEALLPESLNSTFTGKSLKEAAMWLKNKPDTVEFDGKFFGVLDHKATGENGKGGKVVLCRIGDAEGQGDEVHCVLMPVEESTLTLGGMEHGTFDQLLEGKGEYTPFRFRH